MRPGDRVCLRDDPSVEGTVCKLSGHKAIVRWTSHTTTVVSRHALQFEDCDPMTKPAQMMQLSERLAYLRKQQAATNSPQLSKGETHNG